MTVFAQRGWPPNEVRATPVHDLLRVAQQLHDWRKDHGEDE